MEVSCEGYDYPDDPFILKGMSAHVAHLEHSQATRFLTMTTIIQDLAVLPIIWSELTLVWKKTATLPLDLRKATGRNSVGVLDRADQENQELTRCLPTRSSELASICSQ